jgi:hypoxanthine phosphoribosyltransferase
MFYDKDIQEVIWDEEAIQQRIKVLAREVEQNYKSRLEVDGEVKPLILVGLLKGAFLFLADLMREITDIPVEVDFVRIASYGEGTTSGELRFIQDLVDPVLNRHILIVEDIVDTGNTLHFLADVLSNRGAASTSFCVLIDKRARREKSVGMDYIGFECDDDKFLVGYGLDYAEKYRNLNYIGDLDPSAL